MNSASSLRGRLVVARLELLQADEILGVDDRLLHGAPAFTGRMAGEVFVPHGEGFRIFLLPVIDLAQRPTGLGQFFAILPARVLQEMLQRGHGLVIMRQMELALGDLQMGRRASSCVGKRLMKSSRAATPRRRSSSLPGWGQCHVSARWKAASAGQSRKAAGTIRLPSALPSDFTFPSPPGTGGTDATVFNNSRQAFRACGSLPAASRHSPIR